MIPERYHTLLSCFLDETITDEQLENLRSILDDSDEALTHFRKQIFLAELLSQEFNPGRSGSSFIHSMRMKKEYQKDASRFMRQFRQKANEQRPSARKPQQRKARRRLPIIWISIAGCLIIMAGAYFYNIYQMRQIPGLIKARIIERQGKVKIKREGSKEIIDLINDREMEIHAGDVIETGPQAYAVIQYTEEDTRIEISDNTTVTIDKKNKCKVMEIETGRIELRVDKQPEGAGLRVMTPHAQAIVVGTVFAMIVRHEYTRLNVIEGKVRIFGSRRPDPVDVRGGWFAELGPGKPRIHERLPAGMATTVNSVIVPAPLRLNEPAFSKVRNEALRPNNGPGGRPLPLVAHWHRSSLSPDFQIELIKKGYPVLPWLAFSYHMKAEKIKQEYTEALAILREHRMPVMLLYGNQWEAPFYSSEKYRNLSEDETGLGINPDGSRMNRISPFSPVGPWYKLGKQWTHNPAAEVIQDLYPDPPLVLFCSNNQPKKLRWHQAGTSKRYIERYGRGRGPEFKRRIFGDNWIKRYKALFSGMKEGLDKAAWKQNIRFVGFNAFGPDHFGRWKEWMNYSLVTSDRISPYWYAWDGSVTELYDNDWEPGKRAYSLWSMQTEAMNLVFMKQEAFEINPDFWFELIFWDGDTWSKDTEKAGIHKKAGVNYSPGYYKGWTQYCMWMLTPRVAREWHSSVDDRRRWWHYFQGILNAVCAVHQDPVLRKFWRRGGLVPNTGTEHPFRIRVPEKWKDVPRWYHLHTDLDPYIPAENKGTYDASAKECNPDFPVWTMARVLGTRPNREWLLYVFAPMGAKNNVAVSIPECKTVHVDAPVNGAFYHIIETAVNRTDHY